MANASDYDGLKYNKRTAEANATRQQATPQIARLDAREEMLGRQQTDLERDYGEGLVTDDEYTKRMGLITEGFARNAATRETNQDDLSGANFILGQQKNTGRETVTVNPYDPQNPDKPMTGTIRSAPVNTANRGYVPPGAVVDQSAAGRDARLGIGAGRNGFVDTSNISRNGPAGTYKTDAEVAQEAAAGEQKNAALYQQGVAKNDMRAQERQSMGSDPAAGLMQQANDLSMTDPTIAKAFLPAIQDLNARTRQNEERTDQELTEFENTDRNANGVTDGVESAVASSKAAAIDDKADLQATLDENKSIALEQAQLNKDMMEMQQKKFELQQLYNENQLREKNAEQELKNRRAAARMGITADTNGLKWMSEEIRKGNEAFAFLQQAGDLQDAEFALQIGKQFSLDVRNTLNTHSAESLKLSSQLRQQMAELDEVVSLDAKERKKERRDILEKFWERQDKIDSDAASVMKDYRTELFQQQRDKRKEDFDVWKMQQEQAHDMKKFGMQMQKDQQISPLQSLEWQKKIADGIKNLDSVKAFDKVDRDLKKMELAFASGKGGDEALIVLWEKMLDPTSVVREGEYARVAATQGFGPSVVEAVKRLGFGGAGIDDKKRLGLIELAREFHSAAKDDALQDAQQELMLARDFNNTPGVSQPISIESLPFMNRLDLTEDDAESALDYALNGDQPETYASAQDWISTVGTGQVIEGSPYHRGEDANALDIDGKIGDPIRPFASGRVVEADSRGTGPYGKHVVILDAEGNRHLYAHLNNVNVKEADSVSTNDLIGKMGNTGNVIKTNGDGSHLHYSVSKGGKAVALDHVHQEPQDMVMTAQGVGPKVRGPTFNVAPQGKQLAFEQSHIRPF